MDGDIEGSSHFLMYIHSLYIQVSFEGVFGVRLSTFSRSIWNLDPYYTACHPSNKETKVMLLGDSERTGLFQLLHAFE